MNKPELIISNYDPETDYNETIRCMMHLGFYREGQDTAKRMRDIVNDTPDAIRIARFVRNDAIEGCVQLPNSTIPLMCRQGLRPGSLYPESILHALVNDASRILREREARQLEDLIDVNAPLPDINDSPALRAAALRGFRPAYSLVGVVRDLWTPDGLHAPDIPIDDFVVRR